MAVVAVDDSYRIITNAILAVKIVGHSVGQRQFVFRRIARGQSAANANTGVDPLTTSLTITTTTVFNASSSVVSLMFAVQCPGSGERKPISSE